jgi:hypothetical protein
VSLFAIMKTPLPAASPSALTTQGGRATDIVSAAATPASRITSFAKAFEPSIRAAAALGPKTAMPAIRRSSATPATSGPSGPTITRSAGRLRASSINDSPSSAWIGWQVPS